MPARGIVPVQRHRCTIYLECLICVQKAVLVDLAEDGHSGRRIDRLCSDFQLSGLAFGSNQR